MSREVTRETGGFTPIRGFARFAAQKPGDKRARPAAAAADPNQCRTPQQKRVSSAPPAPVAVWYPAKAGAQRQNFAVEQLRQRYDSLKQELFAAKELNGSYEANRAELEHQVSAERTAKLDALRLCEHSRTEAAAQVRQPNVCACSAMRLSLAAAHTSVRVQLF